MALLLQLRARTKKYTLTNYSLFHFFSTFNPNSDELDLTATSSSDNSPYFTPKSPSNSSANSASPPFKDATHGEIHKNFTQFQCRVSDPDSTPPSSLSTNQISSQEIYRRNMARKPGESTPPIAALREMDEKEKDQLRVNR